MSELSPKLENHYNATKQHLYSIMREPNTFSDEAELKDFQRRLNKQNFKRLHKTEFNLLTLQEKQNYVKYYFNFYWENHKPFFSNITKKEMQLWLIDELVNIKYLVYAYQDEGVNYQDILEILGMNTEGCNITEFIHNHHRFFEWRKIEERRRNAFLEKFINSYVIG